MITNHLETTTTATALSAGAVSGDGGDILNTADSQTGTGQGTESALSTGTRGLGASTTSGTDLNVDSVDTEL